MKIHPQDFVLREFLQEPQAVAENVPEHLERCDLCKRRLEALSRAAPEPPRIQTSYDAAFDRGFRLLEARQAALARERAEAPHLLARLREHPPERQELLLRNHPRFQTWGLLEGLIREAQEKTFNDPGSAEVVGRLALKLAPHLDDSYYGTERIEDLQARAWGYRGNARRVGGDLQGADGALEKALGHLQRGTGDSLEKAILLDLKASLRKNQYRFGESLRLSGRAAAIFQGLGEVHKVGRTLVNMATAHEYRGEPESAIALLHRSLDLIDFSQEPRVLVVTSHNLIYSLTSAGRLMEAQGLFTKMRPLYEKFPEPWIQNRRKWAEGRIALGLARYRTAETLLLEARDGFTFAGVPYYSAFVAQDLASLRTRWQRR